MFKATKPFNDKVTAYPKEPSLRIGRSVPKDAVNLAYYYNPTATDAEKVLASEAPRNTIDHRVEEAYRYLFNQASDDDNLFPASVMYEDEEGYVGRLGRMYVNWYPEAHIETKNVQQHKDVIVINKSELPKMIEYSDASGYIGNLYLDAVDYTVTKTKDITTQEVVDRAIYNHELNYHDIFGGYISSSDLDTWMAEPTATTNTMWPNSIIIDNPKCIASGGNTGVRNYVNNTYNPYDDAIGKLVFDKLEYEQVYKEPSTDGEQSVAKDIPAFKGPDYQYTGSETDLDAINVFVNAAKNQALDMFPSVFDVPYDPVTDTYDYTSINDFIILANTYCDNLSHQSFINITNATTAKKDIAIYIDRIDMVLNNPTAANSKFHFEAKYKYRISTRGTEGGYQYNVVAVYKTNDDAPLKKTITKIKEVSAEYKAKCEYVGIARKVWYDYDGVAYYRGAVTKGNSVGNMNPDSDNEILMFSDENGYLRRPVTVTDENGNVTLKNFYRVEADYVYITDVFKNNKACFYKYPLKQDIYDYRGPDNNGFYIGDAVKLFTANLKDLPDGYEHNMKLRVSEYETVDDITNDFNLTTKEIPKRYNAELYTSFISTSTDTFKVIYNAFNDNDSDNVALDNGVTEDVYNYPFMIKNKDFFMEVVDGKARVNKIYLPKPYRLRDSRHYVTFSYYITATRKGIIKKDITGADVIVKEEATICSSLRTASILNKDYALPVEYSKFDGRAMIISPEQDGIYMSPMDIILYDQAARRDETIITSKDTDFVFSVTIQTNYSETDLGCINIKCNPDGSGVITAETTVDTGFVDGKDLYELDETFESTDSSYNYTRKLDLDSPYFIEKGWIYPGIKVKCMDSRHIKVQAPREDGLLESWYPMLQFGHYTQILDQYGTHIKVCYTMPEYDTQHFSVKFGSPYVDIANEEVVILNPHMVKTKCFPLFVNENEETIHLYKKVDNELFPIEIENISFSDGIIITKDAISENDNIICDYTYVEENYVYRGYWRNKDDFVRIDLNPNKYHTYSDLNYIPSETKPSKNLFNKVIYFFMRPTAEYEVSAENDSLIYDIESDDEVGKVTLLNESSTLYHKIDDSQPDSDHDIYIGSVYIRQNTSLHSTILVDSRTRGGGVLSSMSDSLRKELEPESDFYLDIGYYDGEPYQENGVIIIRLDNSLLKEFGGRFTQGDIETKVKRWLGFGVYPIIEYVDSYSKRDMPQYNLIVEDSYTNVIDITPELLLECVDIS